MSIRPRLSVVVVVFDMARELTRTLQSLDPEYQLAIAADEYEVIVVDNGSPDPVAPEVSECFGGRVRVVRVEGAKSYPGPAANLGISLAEGEMVGVMVDGARMASPGLLAHALIGLRLSSRGVVATPGWHLGPFRHMDAADRGWDRSTEDTLLEGLRWRENGYRLFDVSTPSASSARGLLEPMGETNALFMRRGMWGEVGGFDAGFDLLGGGLSNHDLFRRSCELPGARLVVLPGEGTFHQIHGGAATSGRIAWDEMHEQYVELRGRPFRPPTNERTYIGRLPSASLRALIG